MAPESLLGLISVKDSDPFLLNNVYLNSNQGRRSFSYAAPRYWNPLPRKIRYAASLDSFKRSLKYLLFNEFDTFKSTAFMYN